MSGLARASAKVSAGFWRLRTQTVLRARFATMGRRSTIRKPMMIGGAEFIHLGSQVQIRDGARLEVIALHGPRPVLRIGDQTNIEQNVHIVCHHRVEIGKRVSITGNCAIVDVTHPYEDVDDPRKIGERIQQDEASVVIGDGCFVGFGSVILPETELGEYCVVGANSVVKGKFPSYCVVAGNPAQVVRRYDRAARRWVNARDMEARGVQARGPAR